MRKGYALLIIPMIATGAAWAAKTKTTEKTKTEKTAMSETTGTGSENRTSEVTDPNAPGSENAATGQSSSGDVKAKTTTQETSDATSLTATGSPVAKNDYIKSVESQLSSFEGRIATLKAERESVPPTSERYVKLNSAVTEMERKCFETREQLNELKTALGDWSSRKSRIDANLADLQRSSDSVVAE